MYSSKVISALAVVGVASAASSTSTASVCSQATATIANQADASSLASCTTFTGNIAIQSSASGIINFPGIEQINGDFTALGATNLTEIFAPSVNSISGAMHLDTLTLLATLSFPELTSVGSIEWNNLPALQELTFTSTVSQAPQVSIIDTQLQDLNGINLATVDTMLITGNTMLTTISTQVSNVTKSLEIDSNGLALMVQLPNLKNAGGDLTFRNTSGVTIPSLASVTGTLSFLGNSFDTISAPNLTSVSGLVVNSNSALTNISMTALATIGTAGITVENNTNLLDISSFPAVTKVSGAFDFLGNFTTLTMPKLGSVAGAFIAKSSGNFSCDFFDKLNDQAKIASKVYECVPTAADVSNDGSNTSTTGTSTGSSASSTSTKKSSADALVAPVTFGLVGGLFAMLL